MLLWKVSVQANKHEGDAFKQMTDLESQVLRKLVTGKKPHEFPTHTHPTKLLRMAIRFEPTFLSTL